MPDFGVKKAYRPEVQEWPGYKTVVDQKSQLGIEPAQTESTSLDRGQSNLDSMWPVQESQSREKERALPLPSNHDKKREKRIGPTVYNKPRKSPDRTLSQPGSEYGHPTKYDYNYVRRRQDVTAIDLDELEDLDESQEEISLDDQIEILAKRMQGPFPTRHQKSQGGSSKLRSKRWYKRHKSQKSRQVRKEYRLRGKRDPRKKLKRKYRRMYPKRYTRRGIDSRTPGQKTKAWRMKQKDTRGIQKQKDTRERQRPKDTRGRSRGQRRKAGMDLLSEVTELLGFDWSTQVKKTEPPEQLDQNYGKGQSYSQGTPRSDPGKQKGESLRAPDLSSKPQEGLQWDPKTPASGGLSYPQVTTMNPTDGSGKVIPMSYYTDIVNNTQQLPDSRQDRYLLNNNEVKQGHARVAMTVGEILQRCDRKIKERAKEYTPQLTRTDTKNWIWDWTVGKHHVRVQAFKQAGAVNFTKLNLRVSCSCPFWRWWGPEHWGTEEDYQRGQLQGTAAYPAVRDPAHWKPVCKHAYAVLEKSQKFFVRPSKSPLRKLGSRFSVDSTGEIEIELVNDPIVARVAQQHLLQKISQQVLRRYLGREGS